MAEETLTKNPSPSDPIAYPKSINGQQLKTYIFAALSWLKTNQQTVNSLNVFQFQMETQAPTWC